jgi:hypothetical protein
VEGWTWSVGTPNEAVEPPLVSFDEVCGAAAAEGTPVAQGNATAAGDVMPAANTSATQTAAMEATGAAALPATGTTDQMIGEGATAESVAATNSWLVYAVFALIVVGLGIVWVALRRGKRTE